MAIGVICCVFSFSSCTIDDSPGQKEKEQQLSLEEARADFENNASDLRLVEFFNKASSSATKAGGENIVPDWEHAVYGTTANSSVYMVPLATPANQAVSFYAKTGYYDIVKNSDYIVKSYLVIEKLMTGQVKRFISTAIGEVKNNYASEDPFLYTGSREHFNGFMLYSNEEGTSYDAHYYGGGRSFELRPDTASTHNHQHLTRIGFSIHPKRTYGTKGGDGGYIYGEDTWLCSYCYQQVSGAQCPYCGAASGKDNSDNNHDNDYSDFLIYCVKCHFPIDQCICIDVDPTDPAFDVCPYCGKAGCTGECQNPSQPKDNTPIGEGNDKEPNIPAYYVPVQGDVFPNRLNIFDVPSTTISAGVNMSPFVAVRFADSLINNSYDAYAAYLTDYCNTYGADAGVIMAGGLDVSNSNFSAFLSKYFEKAAYTVA